MGDLYAEGSGVPKDYTQAAEWYRKAVEQGSVIGNNRMGGLYEEGNGVPQDYAQAAEWYRKTAEQGDVVGNFNMGDLYAEGNGVSQDYAQAAEYYRKAAEQGSTYAQFKLGHMYGMGQGVEQSAEKHYFWVYIPAVLSDTTKKEIEEIYPLFVLFGLSKKDFARIEKDADDLIQKKGWKSNKEWERNIRNLIGH